MKIRMEAALVATVVVAIFASVVVGLLFCAIRWPVQTLTAAVLGGIWVWVFFSYLNFTVKEEAANDRS